MALTLVPPCDLGTQVSEATRRKETDKETTLPTLFPFRIFGVSISLCLLNASYCERYCTPFQHLISVLCSTEIMDDQMRPWFDIILQLLMTALSSP